MTGRSVRYAPVGDDELTAWLVAAGTPAPLAATLADIGVARRAGWLDVVTHAAERLTGRPPTSVAAFLAAARPLA